MPRKGRSDAGRRRKAEPERKSVVLTVRVDSHVKADLDRARAANGRKLGQEIQHRLTESLGKQKELFGDERTYRLAQIIAECVRFMHMDTGVHWRDDRWTFAALLSCIHHVLQFLTPEGDMQQPPRIAANVANLKAIGAPEFMQQEFSKPGGVGRFAAMSVISGLAAAGSDFNDTKMNILPRAGHVLGVKLTQKDKQS